MNKEELLKLGLTEEQTNKVLEANTEQLKGFIPKHRFDEVNNDNKNLKSQLTDRDNQLSELKKNNKDNEELNAQIKKLQEDNKAATEKYEAELSKIKLDNAVNTALLSAKAKNSKAVKALLDLDKVNLDGENLTGLEEQIKALREAEDSKFLFEVTEEPKQEKQTFTGVVPGQSNTNTSVGDNTPKTYSQMLAELG